MNHPNSDRFRFKTLLYYLRNLLNEYVFENVQLVTYERSLIDVPRIDSKMKIKFRLAELRDLKKLAEVTVFPCLRIRANVLRRRHEETTMKRLRDGDICFLAEDEKGDIVGFCWIVFHQSFVREIARALSTKLQPKEALIYDGFVVPQYRGNRIWEKLLEEALRFLDEKECLRAYVQVSHENVPSTKSVLRVGFRPRNVVRIVRLFAHSLT